MLTAAPAPKTQLLGVVALGGGEAELSNIALMESFDGTIDVALNASPGTIAIGALMAPQTDGTWKVVTSGTAYARIVQPQSLPGLVEVELLGPYAIPA